MTALPPEVADLEVWIGQDLDDPAYSRAAAVLSAASALASRYAGKDWSQQCPDDVFALVVQVASRAFLGPVNPNVKNAAVGPFVEGYFDGAANGVYFNDEEKAQLSRYRSGPSGLWTLSTTREEICVEQMMSVTDGEPVLYLHSDDSGL